MEILDDRYDRRSTIVTSQQPVDQRHAYLVDPTVADAILDRLVHNSSADAQGRRKWDQVLH